MDTKKFPCSPEQAAFVDGLKRGDKFIYEDGIFKFCCITTSGYIKATDVRPLYPKSDPRHNPFVVNRTSLMIYPNRIQPHNRNI